MSSSSPSPTMIKSRPFISICPHSTRQLCQLSQSQPSPSSSSKAANNSELECNQVHFIKNLKSHTEQSLGDCSYLNTCHRMETCRYIHYSLEIPTVLQSQEQGKDLKEKVQVPTLKGKEKMLSKQWIQFDLRELDVSVLGKFDVIIADPPWAIHQELPYGTLTDEEMMKMPIGQMQSEGGLLFLWVTGRAMELGRTCLNAWGYERIDELIWVKTNQLQGLIRTGRTGHWLNHSKEHCIVAIRKSSTSTNNESTNLPSWFKKGLDTQVLLAEVRETSRKPDELYQIIERLLSSKDEEGGGRKCELFGRNHNLRDGWLTLGNQFDQPDQILELEMFNKFNARYPNRRNNNFVNRR